MAVQVRKSFALMIGLLIRLALSTLYVVIVSGTVDSPGDTSSDHDGVPLVINNLQSKLNFLKTYEADSIDHQWGKKLETHLIETANRLESWGLAPHVQDAGLFHSVYGTETFKIQAIPKEDRSRVQKTIGKEAEQLAWIFGNMEREYFYQKAKQLGESLPQNKNEESSSYCVDSNEFLTLNCNKRVRNNETDECPLKMFPLQIPELAAMVFANTMEILPPPDTKDFSYYYKRVCWELDYFRSVLPERAIKDAEAFLKENYDPKYHD